MRNVRAIATAVTIAGTLGFAALGLGPSVANAAPPLPDTPGIPWQQDGHGHGHWHGDDWGGDGGGWGGDWGGGPGWGWGGVPGPFGCIGGPVGPAWAVGCV
ncbi:hypothetical protein [Mycobacterium sp.]|jgi:hypothetical protein|uniref:hypothetical protein n=1 Tax=Mycobacterium sp. TaxID=1785 RepID=UPI002D655BE8|nr:hypothetical protein [Mycobacterium sp.]HZA12373.1 hypothetical protein [Mycobacterium sp.]